MKFVFLPNFLLLNSIDVVGEFKVANEKLSSNLVFIMLTTGVENSEIQAPKMAKRGRNNTLKGSIKRKLMQIYTKSAEAQSVLTKTLLNQPKDLVAAGSPLNRLRLDANQLKN